MTLPDQPSALPCATHCASADGSMYPPLFCAAVEMGLPRTSLSYGIPCCSCSCWMATPGHCVEPESVMSDVQSVNAEYWL